MNNAEKLRREKRLKVHCRRLHRVEYVPPTQERLTCIDCGLSEVQEVGGAKFKMDPAVAKKLAHYRGKKSDGSDGGIMAECRRCTQRERDRLYPKGWSPFGPPARHGVAPFWTCWKLVLDLEWELEYRLEGAYEELAAVLARRVAR